MHLPLFIAGRYLFAKKSHNVINIISIISAAGIAIGTMALVVILSVYNGFDSIVKSFYESHRPAFVISPAKGKQIFLDEKLQQSLAPLDEEYWIMPVTEEDVFVQYGNNQAIAHIIGVDTLYGRISGIDKNVREGEFNLRFGEREQAVVGRVLASQLRLRPHFVTPLEFYFPDKNSNITPSMLLGPMGSMLALGSLNYSVSYPSGIISLDADFDERGIYLSLSCAAELLGHAPNEYTSLQLFPKWNGSGDRGASMYEKRERASEKYLTGELTDFLVKNRYKQNETLYKLMKSEKFAVYLILFFVIIVISINIFSSLSMLILEKHEDMEIYRAMGTPDRIIAKIFRLQGWLISLFGAVAGMLIGLALCYIQKYTGVISMPGNYIVSSYPVVVEFTDIFITFCGVALIGYIIAILPVMGIGKRN